MKVKVRTKQGGFRDDRVELTTKWQEFDESEVSATWVDNPNIQIMRDGKEVPTPDPGEATTVISRTESPLGGLETPETPKKEGE